MTWQTPTVCVRPNPVVLTAMLLFFVGGCGQRTRQMCRMTNEYVVSEQQDKINAMALFPTGPHQLLAAWSTAAGTYLRPLNSNGVPQASPWHIDQNRAQPKPAPKTFLPQTDLPTLNATHIGGFFFAAQRGLLCLTLPPGNNRENGSVVAIRVNLKKRERTIFSIAPLAGRDSAQVACVGISSAEFIIAWQDEDADRSTIHLARVKNGIVTKKRTLGPGHNQFGLAMAQTPARELLLVWSRAGVQDGKLMVTRLDRQLNKQGEHPLFSLKHYNASPYLTKLEANQFGLLFRDNRDDDQMKEFYFTRLNVKGDMLLSPVRISRADGPDGPTLAVGKSQLFSAQIRSYRNNYLVGFNRFNRLGKRLGGEFQVYADKCDFLKTTLIADGNHVTLMYGESSDELGRVLSADIHCAQKQNR